MRVVGLITGLLVWATVCSAKSVVEDAVVRRLVAASTGPSVGTLAPGRHSKLDPSRIAKPAASEREAERAAADAYLRLRQHAARRGARGRSLHQQRRLLAAVQTRVVVKAAPATLGATQAARRHVDPNHKHVDPLLLRVDTERRRPREPERKPDSGSSLRNRDGDQIRPRPPDTSPMGSRNVVAAEAATTPMLNATARTAAATFTRSTSSFMPDPFT